MIKTKYRSETDLFTEQQKRDNSQFSFYHKQERLPTLVENSQYDESKDIIAFIATILRLGTERRIYLCYIRL
jgi:hypothetical protein